VDRSRWPAGPMGIGPSIECRWPAQRLQHPRVPLSLGARRSRSSEAQFIPGEQEDLHALRRSCGGHRAPGLNGPMEVGPALEANPGRRGPRVAGGSEGRHRRSVRAGAPCPSSGGGTVALAVGDGVVSSRDSPSCRRWLPAQPPSRPCYKDPGRLRRSLTILIAALSRSSCASLMPASACAASVARSSVAFVLTRSNNQVTLTP
jgi:hypothetical protein